MKLGDLDDLKVHISELMLVYSGTELNNAILDAIDNSPTVEEVSIIEFKEPLPPVKAQKIIRALNKRPQDEWRDRMKEHFREASDIGGDMFHLSDIERILDGEVL